MVTTPTADSRKCRQPVCKKTFIMKYGDLSLGQIEALVNKLGGMDGVNKFLRGELIISEPERNWCEKDGIIRFSVTSDGTTGKEWFARLIGKQFRVSRSAQSVLCSESFKPTNGITYEIAVLKGELFSNNERIASKIRKDAKNRNLTMPNAEIACLIREKFSDKDLKDMGLCWMIIMHKAIKDCDSSPVLLGVDRNGDGFWLGASCDESDRKWALNNGFVFVISQI